MRKRTSIMLVAAFLMLLPPATPHANALPAYQIEIYYFNHGSEGPDGEVMQISCGGWSWTSGDTTPDHGGLKVVITTDCRTYEETIEWHRWDDSRSACNGTPYWHWIAEPYYDNALAC